jgi:uncharacterized protein YndB with AHSA1/START domain
MDKSSIAGLPAEFTLFVQKEVEIDAPASVVFDAILEEAGPGLTGMDGKSMNLRLEAWPGGRWYRDLGNNTGHLWGHVQVIKPPTLLELSGPMFMSYPALNHVEIKLAQAPGGTQVTLRHRAIGILEEAHRQNIGTGWKNYLDNVLKDFA